MKELTISATIENIERVTDFVNEQLESFGCSMKAQMQIDIAIDELVNMLYLCDEKTIHAITAAVQEIIKSE